MGKPFGAAMSKEAETLFESVKIYLNQQVVLDTAEPIVFLGTLKQITGKGFWLENADIHDCRDGHANKEHYAFESQVEGVRTNRKRIFVMSSAVISISALSEVVPEDLRDQAGPVE